MLIEGFMLFLHEKHMEKIKLSCGKHAKNVAPYILLGNQIHVVS
jgi:hypothetical protein